MNEKIPGNFKTFSKLQLLKECTGGDMYKCTLKPNVPSVKESKCSGISSVSLRNGRMRTSQCFSVSEGGRLFTERPGSWQLVSLQSVNVRMFAV